MTISCIFFVFSDVHLDGHTGAVQTYAIKPIILWPEKIKKIDLNIRI